MSKIVRWFFTPYEKDDHGSYIHHGVGYSGTPYHRGYGRNAHKGVGYGGLYE